MAYAEMGEVFSMIVIDGPAELCGELKVQGAKNSTLPLLAATVPVSYTHLRAHET